MTIDGLASAAATGGVVATAMLREGLDQAGSQAAQLLQSLPQPQAPQPAHMGSSVDMYA